MTRSGRVTGQKSWPGSRLSVEKSICILCVGSPTFWEVELRHSAEILHPDWLMWVNRLIGKLRSTIGSQTTSFTNLSHHRCSSGLNSEPTDFMTGLFLLSLSVFGRQFVKWLALCCRTLSVLSCPVLSVTLVYCGQTVGWIKVPRGMEVGLGPGHIVLDGTQLPHKRDPAAPTFRPISVVAKWLDGSGCHRGRPWPRWHCVRLGPSSPPC